MALKVYEWRGGMWQFEESKAPTDAKPVQAKQAKPPANKARKAPASKQA